MEKVHCCGCLFRTLTIGRAVASVNWPRRGVQMQMGPARRLISSSRHVQNATGLGKGAAARVQATMDEHTSEHLKENKLKYKEHPGVFHLAKVTLPQKFVDAVRLISSHENVKRIVENAEGLRNYLWSRKPPIENEQYKDKVSKLENQLRTREEVLLPFLSQEEIDKLDQKRETELFNRLRKTVYHWEPVRYTRDRGLEYIFGRSAGEYATMCRIFNEIAKRDPQFQPTTLCDFGSGIGTVSWAARQYWSSSLLEHLCADVSWEMHDLAELILRGGARNDDHPIPALFLRNHLPESYKIRYDIVVSAFSLMELPSAKDRLETIDKLWNKTEQYLVLVEQGTVAGFRLIQEARAYILGLGSPKKKSAKCYVFSPCPSSMECPRFSFDTTACNFQVKYRPVYPFHHDNCVTDTFSYVVIRRGFPDPSEERWPRLVEEPMIRPRHIICRLCTKDATLSEAVLTKAKHSQELRLIAKRSGWGDLLPIHLEKHHHKKMQSSQIDSTETGDYDDYDNK